jgi:hypothetical protein
MNKELTEKFAIREYLMALQALAQVGDVKKLADLLKQKDPMEVMWRNYQDLMVCMTQEQESRGNNGIAAFNASADVYLERGEDRLTDAVTRFVPLMLADLDDLEREFDQQPRKHLYDKIDAIKEYLLAFKDQGTEDLKKLADLAMQQDPEVIWRNYQELAPYMTIAQQSRATWLFCFQAAAHVYLRKGPSFQPGKDALTNAVTRLLPRMLDDLGDLGLEVVHDRRRQTND